MTDIDVEIQTAFDFERIARWYAGRARGRAIEILPRVAQSAALGQWEPRLSRVARAALSRQVTRSGGQWIPDAQGQSVHVRLDGLLALRLDGHAIPDGCALYTSMILGHFYNASYLLAAARHAVKYDAVTEGAASIALAWAEDFAPLAVVFHALDAVRPKPCYAFRQISQIVLNNVARVMGLSFETVRMPEIRWVERTRIGPSGNLIKIWVSEILWPDGTRHGASRFSSSTQCEACGHRIKSGNWIPLVLDGSGGPASLWVGRDCARHLFGCQAGVNAKDALFDRSPPGSPGSS